VQQLGCGKPLRRGEMVWDRWGIILCDDCDKKRPASIMAVYYGGRLNRNLNCGDRVFHLKGTRRVKGKLKAKKSEERRSNEKARTRSKL